MDAYEVRPIGVVRSSLKDKAAAPRQGDEGAPAATIVVLPEARAALDGLEAGAELVVLTWLHQADRDVLKVHPRDDLDRPLTGVFATRSSDRPNPVGLHRVTVLGISRGEVEVEPLEAVDGTPVIDLKPVLTSSR
jgi:tRNA-Thr(GGU) m(6)t(6)A37 methyltransferase TsaA